MHPRPERTTTVFNPGRLESLAQELGTAEPARTFFANYLKQLPRRITAIAEAIDRLDADAVLTAILSLQTSSVMVGAVELEAQGTALASLPMTTLSENKTTYLADLACAAARFMDQTAQRVS